MQLPRPTDWAANTSRISSTCLPSLIAYTYPFQRGLISASLTNWICLLFFTYWLSVLASLNGLLLCFIPFLPFFASHSPCMWGIIPPGCLRCSDITSTHKCCLIWLSSRVIWFNQGRNKASLSSMTLEPNNAGGSTCSMTWPSNGSKKAVALTFNINDLTDHLQAKKAGIQLSLRGEGEKRREEWQRLRTERVEVHEDARRYKEAHWGIWRCMKVHREVHGGACCWQNTTLFNANARDQCK